MTSKTHEVIGFAGLVTAAVIYPPEHLWLSTVIVALIANLIGTLLPDIDQASNRLWDMIPGGNTMGKIIKSVLTGHRTYSHSVVGLLITYIACNWVFYNLLNNSFVQVNIVIFALMTGYILHLAADSITEEGIPLLWPIKWKFGIPPWKKLRLRTGHWMENWLVFPGAILFTAWWMVTYWRELWSLVG